MSLISNNSFREDNKKQARKTEDMKGEESVSGSMPDPDSDDDVVELEHDSGLYLKENEESPEEADLDHEISEADKARLED